MSLCFRTVSNKLTTFVNGPKKVTKINHQLTKHVKSTLFLEEFFGGPAASVTGTNLKEGSFGSPEDAQIIVPETSTECSNAVMTKYNLKKEELAWSWPRNTIDVRQFGFVEHDMSSGLTGDKYILDSNTWIDTLSIRDEFLKYNANAVKRNNISLFSVNEALNGSQMALGKQKEKVALEGAAPETLTTSQNQPSKRPNDKPSEEHLRVVYENLQRDIPNLFRTPMNYMIYSKDIIFINNIKGITTKGLVSYVKHVAFVRILAHIKFAYVACDVLKMTVHPEDDTIKVRWRVRGVSGMKLMLKFWKFRLWKLREDLRRQEEWYDGFSTYYVNRDGKVYKHVIDKVMPDQDAFLKEKPPIAAKLALFSALASPELSNLSEILLNVKVPMNVAPNNMANNDFVRDDCTNQDSS